MTLVKVSYLLLFLLVSSLPSYGSESKDRAVDLAALQANRSSVKKIQAILKKYKNTKREPLLLMKTGELMTEGASIQFRLSHTIQKKTNDYQKALQESIQVFSDLIRRFPHYSELGKAFYLRGRAYDELKKKDLAEKDFLVVVNRYQDLGEISQAYMTLAQYAIDRNQHERSIQFLAAVEKMPWDALFPFALYKMAWSYYNLKRIPSSLEYLEKHIRYYNKKLFGSENSSDQKKTKNQIGQAETSEFALRENSLRDLALFYFEGFTQDQSKFSPENAFSYFKKVEQGSYFGKILLRYSKLLRSYRYEKHMKEWGQIVYREVPDYPETMEVFLNHYTYHRSRNQFDDLKNTLQSMVSLYKKYPDLKSYEAYQEVQKEWLSTAEFIQKTMIKNKNATGVHALSPVLASVYQAFIDIVPEEDPRIPGVYYNLAETYFAIKDFEKATHHYRWIVDRFDWKKDKNVSDASLKAIASRYEILLKKNLLAKDIKAKALESEDPSKSKLPEVFLEWIGWIDTHRKQTGQTISNFFFETNRTLYSYGFTRWAIERSHPFVLLHPSDDYAIASATLTLDTYLESKLWEKLHETTVVYKKLSDWKDKKFQEKLFVLASNSWFKITEKSFESKKYEETTKNAEFFLSNYKKSEHTPKIFNLAAESNFALKEHDKAIKYLNQLIQEYPKDKSVTRAILTKSEVYESQYKFSEAAKNLYEYLQLPEDMRGKISKSEILKTKEKILTYSFLDFHHLNFWDEIRNSKTFCEEKLMDTCNRYEALMYLRPGSKKSEKKAELSYLSVQAKKAPRKNRSLWASLALVSWKKELKFDERNLMIRYISSGWDELEASDQLFLLPQISKVIPETLSISRAELDQYAPLKADEKSIERRIRYIQDLEYTMVSAAKLPWPHLKALVLLENAEVYRDLSEKLQNLTIPSNLSAEEKTAYQDLVKTLAKPFIEKAENIRVKAFEVVSEFAVSKEFSKPIKERFFAENPEQKKVYEPYGFHVDAPKDIEVSLLDEKEFEWESSKERSKEFLVYQKEWLRSLKEKDWFRSLFFQQKIKEEDLLPKSTLSIMNALLFEYAGSTDSALKEIETAWKNVDSNALRGKLNMLLLSHYSYAYSFKKVKSLLSKFNDEWKPRSREIFTLVYCSKITDTTWDEKKWMEWLDGADTDSREEKNFIASLRPENKRSVASEKTEQKPKKEKTTSKKKGRKS